METKSNNNRPAGRLVPIFAAHDGLETAGLVLRLAQTAAKIGETVLLLDMDGGKIMQEAGIITGVTLGDVLTRGADIGDAKYISQDGHFTAACAGDADLETLLGSLAALSLGYDWVFVCAPAGCTPAHVRLAGAADSALLSYSSTSDNFMRAYWMLNAIRMRIPRFDPLMTVHGSTDDSLETYELFAGIVSEFLGAAPALGGILTEKQCPQDTASALLLSLRQETKLDKKTA